MAYFIFKQNRWYNTRRANIFNIMRNIAIAKLYNETAFRNNLK